MPNYVYNHTDCAQTFIQREREGGEREQQRIVTGRLTICSEDKKTTQVMDVAFSNRFSGNEN